LEKRRLFARLHSGGHLIDVAMIRCGYGDLKPGKACHYPGEASVEYIGNIENSEREALKGKLEAVLKEYITQTLKEESVFSKVLPYDEANQVLKNGVPEYVTKDTPTVRVLKLIEEDPGCPCGGTHVKHVSEIGNIKITKIAKKGKSVRVSYTVE
jgi:Ser-tRNA(Ala) deacylase AlaX